MKLSRPTHLILSALCALPASAVLAQPMPDTARALKTLMEGSASNGNGYGTDASLPGAGTSAMGQSPQGAMPGAGHVHTVRPGETLAKVVHQVYGSHPYKDAPVFRLIVQRNPEAFVGGNHNRLKAGAQLSLPHPAELHAALTAQHPQFQSVAARPPVGAGSSGSGGAGSGGSTASTSPAAGKSVYPGPSAAAGQSTSSSDPRRGWVRFP
ncbi:MAG: hypothetical protein ACO24G_09300 [Burkholderiaceae bacterium]